MFQNTMAEGNGEVLDDLHKVELLSDTERTSDYPKLIEYGLDQKVQTYYILFHILLNCIDVNR